MRMWMSYWRLTPGTAHSLVSEKICPCPQKPIDVREYPEDLAPLRSILLIGGSRWPKSDPVQDPYPLERTHFSTSSKAIHITRFSNSVDWLKNFPK